MTLGELKGASLLAAVVLAALFLWNLSGLRASSRASVVRVYSWSSYFPDEVLAGFTKRTGLKIELTYMSSNEELYAKLRAGATGFDVIQPSDYMVRQMKRANMLFPLDHARLPHLGNLDDEHRRVPYDPEQRYSVPFSWGTTGIAVNTAKVAVPPDGVSWRFLMDSPDRKHTSSFDDMREVFAAAFKLRGLSVNCVEPRALEAARHDIAAMRDRVLLFSSEPKAFLLREELTIAHIYSADAAQAGQENPNIRYFIPKEGATRWTDNLAVPLTAGNVAGAHAFIDYILEPDVALAIVREKRLATPNRAAREKLSDEERNDPAVYPSREALERTEYLDELGPAQKTMSRIWTELKT